ncbi:MAG: flagellar assembly protein FliW [Candidatus Adiutrix intracellularis]|nr:flagellar assembly protein FliW [Candidatus Adiutrix intracellularis]
MIKTKTNQSKKIDVLEDSQVTVPSGLIQLTDLTNFVIIRCQKDNLFYWLKSIDDPNLTLVTLLIPRIFKINHNSPIPLNPHQGLDSKEPRKLFIFVIVPTPPDNPRAITTHLLCLLLVNPRSRRTKQSVLNDCLYPHRYRIIVEDI